jgi:hypothetical protein
VTDREVAVSVTHVEVVSAMVGVDCAECGQPTVRDVVLVNEHGLVLLRGRTCTSTECTGHRYRPETVRISVDDMAVGTITGALSVPEQRLSV